jgi:hypothetical protein
MMVMTMMVAVMRGGKRGSSEHQDQKCSSD